ncbi:MAG: hypothetical protein AAGB01_08700 [Cyanobacteria bacterium P01_F01_bin.42]
MGSLLIVTGISIYAWISVIHYSFLRRHHLSSQRSLNLSLPSSTPPELASPDLILKALIWPTLHLSDGYEPTTQDFTD